MTTATSPNPTGAIRRRALRRRPTAAERRVGYAVAALINVVGLWIVHHLLEWEWPSFLTDDFQDLLPYLTASFTATIIVNLLWAIRDPAWFRHTAQIGLNLVAIRAAVRTWEIFPFDFTGYTSAWETGARVLIVIGLFGLMVATIVEIVGLVRSCLASDERAPEAVA
jgi:hypothetical protein